MAGDDAVRALAADGQACALDVAYRNLEHRVLHAVVYGQGDADGGYLDIAHDAAAVGVQKALVELVLRLVGAEAVFPARQRRIIRHGGIPELGVPLVVQLRDGLGIARDGAALVEGVPPVADRGV